jgi:PAS domain S-box-containing protein
MSCDCCRGGEWLVATVRSIGDGVISTDRESRVTFMNPVAESLTGWSAGEAAGRPLVEVCPIVSESTREPIESPVAHVLRESGVVSLPGCPLLLGRDGVERHIDDSAAPIRDETGQIVGVVLVFRDVTERRRAELGREQLLARERAARRAAEAASRAKDDFLATMSHELRTPVTAIVGWSRMLRTRNLAGPAAARALEIIERNAQAQVLLIHDLLDVSRIVTGKFRLENRPVDLAHVIEAAADSIRPVAEAKGIRLDLDLEPEAGLIAGDANRLEQVLWNLLSNAIRFVPGGGQVQIVLRRKSSRLELSVGDTGQGIAADLLPHIFERFRQGDSAAARQHGGLGLGLAIVSHLVELHGGTVRAASPGAGAGATFTISLPLKSELTPAELLGNPADPAFLVVAASTGGSSLDVA